MIATWIYKPSHDFQNVWVINAVLKWGLLFHTLSFIHSPNYFRVGNLFPHIKLSTSRFRLTHSSRCSERKCPTWTIILIMIAKEMKETSSQHLFFFFLVQFSWGLLLNDNEYKKCCIYKNRKSFQWNQVSCDWAANCKQEWSLWFLWAYMRKN